MTGTIRLRKVGLEWHWVCHCGALNRTIDPGRFFYVCRACTRLSFKARA